VTTSQVTIVREGLLLAAPMRVDMLLRGDS